jgi:hypothetical protein
MKFSLAPKSHQRAGTPTLPLVNLFAEPGDTPGLRPRPGLDLSQTLGAGPILAHIADHQGKSYTLSGTAVYENAALLGSVDPGGVVQWAKSEAELVITSGWSAYLISDGVLSRIGDEDLPQVSGVSFIGGRFYYPNRGLSQFHYSAVGQASDIDGLAFANAESNPDPIVRSETLGDDIAFFGTRSLEWHQQTGDADLPVARSAGRSTDKGCLAAYSVARTDQAIYFVGAEGEQGPQIYRTAGGPAVKVSDASIDAKLQACADLDHITAVIVIHEGHSFYIVNIPGHGSWGLNIGTRLWGEWASYARNTFRLRCGDGGVFGDDETGRLYTFNAETRSDNSDPIIREASVWIPADKPGVIGPISLLGANGVGLLTGQGSNPLVEMRLSRGGLGDFTDWQGAAMGAMGERSVTPQWRQNGMIAAPGMLVQFRWSDPVLTVPYEIVVGEYP